MKNRAIIVSDTDMEELGQFIDALKQSGFRDQRQVEVLDKILQSADIVAPACVPRDVIRMESKFRVLDVNSGKSEQYTLVFPEKADISQGRISILAPLGTAVLGHRAGDQIEADVPAGKRTLRIERVFSARASTKALSSEIDQVQADSRQTTELAA